VLINPIIRTRTRPFHRAYHPTRDGIINDDDDCKLLQCDKDIVQNLCFDNGMKLGIGKTTISSCTYKTNGINFIYKLCKKLVAHSQHVKALGTQLACKHYF
jgi:hypothetical protein